ncbi:MAG: hypothetical protein FJX33_12320 [Alphaproteobacteria bacterium]|nr:hypothetical protein [Alphaproteobacteria bacterium]
MHFRHANEQEVDDRVFLARWSQWFAGPESQGRLSSKDAVPLLNKKISLETLVAAGCGHGLDALCRSIVMKQYENTMQASLIFLDDNKTILKPVVAINPLNERRVNGVRLTDYGLQRLREVA